MAKRFLSEKHFLKGFQGLIDFFSDERIIEIFQSAGKASIMMKPYLQFTNNERLVYLRPRISEIPAVHGGRGGIVLILQDVSQFRELDKMKSEFIAMVTHELRPLSQRSSNN